MNPTQPTPSAVPERPATLIPEAVPGLSSSTPEQPAPVETAPQLGQTAAATPPSTPAQPPVLPVAAVPAVPPVAPAAQTPPVVPTVAGPAIADDVDVIEKEWVDHANAVIEATKNDPYKEEEAIEDLQVDYLKKRYGKDIKKDDPQADEPQT